MPTQQPSSSTSEVDSEAEGVPLVAATPIAPQRAPEASTAMAFGLSTSSVKGLSLAALVIQNSSSFMVLRYTRTLRGPMYLPSVVVLLVELCKLVFCVFMVFVEAKFSPCGCATSLRDEIVGKSRETLKLGVPALCYVAQNNLIFVAATNLSAAAAQVIYQAKTLSTALFSVTVLGKSFSCEQWVSFAILALGVILVQQEDAKAAPPHASPLLGIGAGLSAATLSGFAGVYLELMFTSGATSLWVRNVQLALFSIPLQLFAIWRADLGHIRHHGLFHGFHASTWAVVLVQFAGGMISAVVIKYAGNILKTFATVLAILVTCVLSIFLFDFHPTPIFWAGVAAVCASIWLYSQRDGAHRLAMRLAPDCYGRLRAWLLPARRKRHSSDPDVIGARAVMPSEDDDAYGAGISPPAAAVDPEKERFATKERLPMLPEAQCASRAAAA